MVKFEDERAFPVTMEDGRGGTMTNLGITLRDYFAAKAMQSGAIEIFTATEHEALAALPIFARAAYLIADAMIAERDK